MKPRFRIVTIAVYLAIFTGGGYMAAAGDLNPPPGPVAPTMKALSEIEPRIAISAANTPGDANSSFRIAQPGSYYLAGNLAGESGKSGIEIASSDVTIDLMGHALVGVGGSLGGIVTSAGSVARVVIRNGIVRDWDGAGIDINVANCEISNVIATDNALVGIGVGEGSRVRNCTSRQNGSHGIQTRTGGMIQHCIARQNTGDGIFAGGPNSDVNILDCESSSNSGDGIAVNNRCQVRGNHCGQNGFATGDGAGIHVAGNNNRIEGNTLINADRGLDIDAGDNYVADNVVRGNTDNYDIVAGNQLNILLCQIPESIDWPANVKLAGSLTGVAGQHGIEIVASGVTLDLNGFDLAGVAGSLDGVSVTVTSLTNIAVVNGSVRNWGDEGVDLGSSGVSCRVEGVRASDSAGNGITAGFNSTVTNCSAYGNAGNGIAAGGGSTVTACSTYGNSATGIGASLGSTVTACSSSYNSDHGISVSGGSTVTACSTSSNAVNGINVGNGSTVSNCSAENNTGRGISALSGSTVSDCTTRLNILDGIVCISDCVIRGNNCSTNGSAVGNGAGIYAIGAYNRIEDNNCIGADRGIDVDTSSNIIIKNTAGNNTVNYEIASFNAVGQILTPTTNAAPISGNTYVGGIGTNNPWANFAY